MRRKTLRGCTLVLASALALAGCGQGDGGSAARQDEIRSLVAELDALEAEAALIKDANDIKRLQRAYGFYVDAKMWDAVADLFAEDGSIEIALDGVYQGQDRVREYLYALGNGVSGLSHGELNQHLQLQPVVHVADDGQTAKGRWRALIMTGELDKSAYWGEGTYENTYVKDEGVWKIQSVHWYQTYMVPYEGGWAKNEDAFGGRFVTSLEPDAPPTEEYGVWPDVHFPPFHYDNPVSGREGGVQ